MNTALTKTDFGSFSQTAVAIALSFGISQVTLAPVSMTDIQTEGDKKSWDGYIDNEYYSIWKSDVHNIGRLLTIHKFASDMIDNTVMIDADVARLINKNIRKLI